MNYPYNIIKQIIFSKAVVANLQNFQALYSMILFSAELPTYLHIIQEKVKLYTSPAFPDWQCFTPSHVCASCLPPLLNNTDSETYVIEI